jgi:HK97 family phage major capsid protein
MSGFTTSGRDHLIRSEVWSTQLKEVLLDELMATKYVNWLTEFPDGDQFTIPSIGQAQVDNYEEDTAVKYRAMDTGEFTFAITEYLSSGTYITNKMAQDAFYMNQLVSSFVPSQERAIMVDVETKILGLSASQTASNVNAINGADHRFVGTGTNETISAADFAKARYALKKANVPDTNLIAIVDPSVEYALNTLSNLVNVSNNPMWEGIVSTGIASGMRFTKNVFGFDVYVSNHLADANETIGAKTTAAGKANMFFSATSDVLPFVGAWRQMPKVDSEYNKDFQREEYVTTARYGVKLFRPENLVCVLTDTDQV